MTRRLSEEEIEGLKELAREIVRVRAPAWRHANGWTMGKFEALVVALGEGRGILSAASAAGVSEPTARRAIRDYDLHQIKGGV